MKTSLHVQTPWVCWYDTSEKSMQPTWCENPGDTTSHHKSSLLLTGRMLRNCWCWSAVKWQQLDAHFLAWLKDNPMIAEDPPLVTRRAKYSPGPFMTDTGLQFIACTRCLEGLGLYWLQVVAIKLIQLNFAIFLQTLHLFLAKRLKNSLLILLKTWQDPARNRWTRISNWPLFSWFYF